MIEARGLGRGHKTSLTGSLARALLGETDTDGVLRQMARAVVEALQPDVVGLFLAEPGETALRLRAGAGWPESSLGQATIPLESPSEATYALKRRTPVFSADLSQEVRFPPSSPLLAASVAAVAAAPIPTDEESSGVLLAGWRSRRALNPTEEILLEEILELGGLALAAARRLERAWRSAQEAETLRRSGAVVAASLDQQEAIRRILEQLAQVVPYDSASVQLLQEGFVEIVGGRGWSDPAAVVGLRFPIPGDNPNTRVIQSRRPVILEDAPAAYPPFRQPPHDHIRSWLGVPLIVQNRVIGMLALDSRKPRFYTEEHARLVSAFADHVAIALENARLFRRVRRGREVAAALLDIVQVSTSSLELKQVLKQIAQQTAKVCQANRCTIFLLDDREEYLQPVMSQFADGHADLAQWQKFKSTTADRVDAVPLFRQAIRERRPARLEDPSRTDLIPSKWTRPFGIQKLLIVPLVYHGRCIGLMALDHTDPEKDFTPEQVELAQTIGGQVTGAILNARLFEAEARERRLAETLRSLIAALNTTLDLDEVLERLLDSLAEVLDYQTALVLLPETDGFRVAAARGQESGSIEDLVGARWSREGALEKLTHSRRPLRMTGAALKTLPAEVRRNLPAECWLGMPLIFGGKAVAVLLVSGSTTDCYQDRDVEVAFAFAGQAASVIENARLYAAERDRARQLSALHRATTALLSTLNLKKLHRRILRAAVDAIPAAQTACLLVRHPERGGLHPAALWDGRRRVAGERAGWVGTPEILEAIEQKRPLLITDRESEPRSAILAPLVVHDEAVGGLLLGAPQPGAFTAADLDLLAAFAATAAAALENARLHEEVRQLARTDALTGLYNRRTFFELATRELELARRHRRRLAAIMMDIDRFKRINDTFGHQVGDRVLQAVAERCRSSLRATDILARYGGEEFVILLPENDSADARVVAERLRRLFDGHPLATDQGPVCITLSLGVARVTEGTHELSELLREADAALYEAKRAGGNRVVVAP